LNLVLVSLAAALALATVNGTQADNPVPHVTELCSTRFDGFKEVPKHLCCEAAACLDDIALNLQRDPEARLVVVGNATTLEKTSTNKAYAHNLDVSRALVVKDYFVRDRGINGSRIEVRVGRDGSSNVSNYLVPPHADFDADVPRTRPIQNPIKK
jgi:hypothetical protein